jgi:hypothetical protein
MVVPVYGMSVCVRVWVQLWVTVWYVIIHGTHYTTLPLHYHYTTLHHYPQIFKITLSSKTTSIVNASEAFSGFMQARMYVRSSEVHKISRDQDDAFLTFDEKDGLDGRMVSVCVCVFVLLGRVCDGT